MKITKEKVSARIIVNNAINIFEPLCSLYPYGWNINTVMKHIVRDAINKNYLNISVEPDDINNISCSTEGVSALVIYYTIHWPENIVRLRNTIVVDCEDVFPFFDAHSSGNESE